MMVSLRVVAVLFRPLIMMPVSSTVMAVLAMMMVTAVMIAAGMIMAPGAVFPCRLIIHTEESAATAAFELVNGAGVFALGTVGKGLLCLHNRSS